jgi:hypothetical protein
MATFWKFSTFLQPGQQLSEEEEQRLIDNFNRLLDQ